MSHVKKNEKVFRKAYYFQFLKPYGFSQYPNSFKLKSWTNSGNNYKNVFFLCYKHNCIYFTFVVLWLTAVHASNYKKKCFNYIVE